MSRARCLGVVLLSMSIGLLEPLAARSASSMRRDLRRMVGFTIVGTATLREFRQQGATPLAVLDTGQVFELTGASLALPLSDVVIFSKPVSPALRTQHAGLPERFYYHYKLLVDDEIHDASPK